MTAVDLDSLTRPSVTPSRPVACICGSRLDKTTVDPQSAHYIINRRGNRMNGARCRHCGRHEWFNKDRAQSLGIDCDRLAISKDHACQGCLGSGCNRCEARSCERCESKKSIQVHHFAPEKLFLDYHRWPVAQLCIPCHPAWHSMSTPELQNIKPMRVYVSGPRENAVLSLDVFTDPVGLMVSHAQECREKPYMLASYDHGIKPPCSPYCARCWSTGALLNVTFGPSGQNWPTHPLCGRCATVYQQQMLLASRRQRDAL
jgi:hypothetical protein